MSFEEKLAQALENTAQERAKQICTNQKNHRFSISYKLWKRKALKNLENNQSSCNRSLCKTRHILITAAILISLLLGATVYAVIASIGRYSFDAETEYSKLFIEKMTSDKEFIETYYGLPEENGWMCTDFSANKTLVLIGYECGEKKISFSQAVISEDSTIHISAENAAIEPLSLYEKDDGFYIDHGNGECSVFWIYDGYLFELGGNIAKEEAINLVHSTKIINF